MRTYVSNFKIRLGAVSVDGKLLPVQAAEKPKFKLCTPTGGSVSRAWIDVNGKVWADDELMRKTNDDEEKIINPEDIKEARATQLPNNVMDLTVHSSDCADQIFPDKTASSFVFIPASEDVENLGWHEFLQAAASSPDLVLLSQCAIKRYEGFYRLTTWRGNLCLLRVSYPANLNDHDSFKSTLNSARRKRVLSVVEKMIEPFSPDEYANQAHARIGELIEQSDGKGTPVAPRPKPTKSGDFDLMSALDNLDNLLATGV